MKYKKCDLCGSDLIKVIGSNISCTNEDCENYINDEYDAIYVDFYEYEDISEFTLENIPDNVERDYEEDYDEYLFFSDRKDYISRFEYRKANNFIEDHLFKGKKISNFKRYLEEDELENFQYIEAKYELIDEGRNLENNYQNALEYYEKQLHKKLFRNDYYIYKKLVRFETNPQKQLDLIISFFHSGIYCNRYHYLWFLKKLKMLSEKIYISNEVIDDCLYAFKNNGFTKRKFQDTTVPIAEKIVMRSNSLKVKTDCEYSLNQFKFELKEESSNLNYVKQHDFSTSILEKLILDYSFKPVSFFEQICNNYHRCGDYENELKWIYGFFNKSRRYNSEKNLLFLDKLNKLNVKTSDFYHKSLFFDTNKYYLTKKDFKKNEIKYLNLIEYITLVKNKFNIIYKGNKLEQSNPLEAINYYNSYLGHELFENDYFIYKSLVVLYDQIGDLKKELETIMSFLKSGIYCDRYNYLFFLFNLKKLSQEFVIEDNDINKLLVSFKNVSFKNKYLENTPVPLAERLVFENNEINIIPGEEFETLQEIGAMELESDLYNSCEMFNTANKIFEIMIDEYGIADVELYKQICINYQQLNDIENEKKIIQHYLNNNEMWNMKERNLFENRLKELENSEKDIIPLDEQKFEVFYENNGNYLKHDDFVNSDVGFTELIDKTNLKLKLRRKAWKLEFKDYYKAIDFYKSLLDHELFQDDYYIYRKLVILYVKINEYKLVWQTIKSFFYSGIYCNRYQYIWFLHKVADVSKVMYISDEELTDCLKFFKENGFENKNLEKSQVFLAERLYHVRSSLKINSSDVFIKTQKKYELKEEAGQLESNGVTEQSTEILRNMVDNGCNRSPRDYMRLCHSYRRLGNYDEELVIINKYLSNKHNTYSREWFERRLKEVIKLIDD